MKSSKKENELVCEKNKVLYSANMLAKIGTNKHDLKRCHNVVSHNLGNINLNISKQMKEGAYSNCER